MKYILFLLVISVNPAKINAKSNTETLQCNLTGQLLSTLGTYQEAFRREFKYFTNIIEKSMETFKEKIETDIKTKGDFYIYYLFQLFDLTLIQLTKKHIAPIIMQLL